MSYPTTVRRSVLRDLRAVHALRGTVPAALVRDCAADLGCSERTVWAWWRKHLDEIIDDTEPASAPAPATELTDVHLEVIFACNGNVSEAHRQLMANPETAAITPPRRTLAHWWGQVDAPVRAWAYDGAAGLMDQQMKARHAVEERNQLWRIDHQEFPVWVLPGGRSATPVKPWLTTVIDDATRLIVAFLLTVERPDATSTAVVLADAVRLKPTSLPGVQVGGLPLALLSDNGGEFRSEQLTGMLRRLGIASRRTFPYMKHLNGKVERVQQTMQHELARNLTGYAYGPKTLKLKDLFGLDGDLISEELLVALLDDWVARYNTERPHSALDGRTPLQAWAAQQTPLRAPDMEAVRLAMMPAARGRKVTPDGISFNNQLYTSGELARLRLVGRQVDVRFLPNDESFIEVFDGDDWLCTCVPAHQVSTEDLDLLRQVRKEQYTTARAYHEAARERRALAVATATPDNPVILPFSLATDSSLLGGEDDLLDLTDTSGDGDSGRAPRPPADGSDVVAIPDADDPWDLDAADASADFADDLGAPTGDRP